MAITKLILALVQNPPHLLFVIEELQSLKPRSDSIHPMDRLSQTAPLLPTQLLGKVEDFLGVMSDANLVEADNPKNYDIEELTANESDVIEMDLMLGVNDLHTPEAVAAAESVISSCQPVIQLAGDGSETDSDESSAEDDNRGDKCSDDEHDYGHDNDGKILSSLERSISRRDNILDKQ